jgi:hypothetical protein
LEFRDILCQIAPKEHTTNSRRKKQKRRKTPKIANAANVKNKAPIFRGFALFLLQKMIR